MRKLPFLLLPFLCASAAAPKEFQAIADQARALPAEFAADVLLKLAASPLANDAKWKRELIEDAFLDSKRLPLQTRAVDAMLDLDAQRALILFQAIPTPDLPKLSCQDASTPNLSPYYQTAAALFSRAFTLAQRRKGDDIQFLQQRLSAVDSPSQVAPALKLLDHVELNPPVRSQLTAIFAAALDRVQGGDREFAASEPLLVSAAVPEMHESFFLTTLRAYIVRHVSGPRCSDQIKPAQLPDSVEQFNKLLSRIDRAGVQFRPISAEEAAPLRDDGTYRQQAGPSQHTQKAQAAVAALSQDGPERTTHYFEALRLIENWKPEEEASPDEYLRAVSASYRSLLDVSVSRNGLSSALHFFERQYDAMENRDLWFQEYRRVFSPRTDRDWLLDQLTHSRNPVISVYAQMDQLLGTS